MCHVLRNIQRNIQIKVSYLAVGVIYKPQASSSINFHGDVHFNFFSKCNRTWRFKCCVTHHITVVKNDVGHKNPHGVVTPSHTVGMEDGPCFEEYTKEYSNKSVIFSCWCNIQAADE